MKKGGLTAQQQPFMQHCLEHLDPSWESWSTAGSWRTAAKNTPEERSLSSKEASVGISQCNEEGRARGRGKTEWKGRKRKDRNRLEVGRKEKDGMGKTDKKKEGQSWHRTEGQKKKGQKQTGGREEGKRWNGEDGQKRGWMSSGVNTSLPSGTEVLWHHFPQKGQSWGTIHSARQKCLPLICPSTQI